MVRHCNYHRELEPISNPMRTARLQQGLSADDDIRIRYKRFWSDYEKLSKRLIASGVFEYELGRYLPQFPREFHSLTCGAKTRAGTPCKMKCIYYNGRCKLHGGLSTGPLTEEGKARAAKNGLIPKKKANPMSS